MNISINELSRELNIPIAELRTHILSYKIEIQKDSTISMKDADILKSKIISIKKSTILPQIIGTTPENREKTKHEKRFEQELKTKQIKSDGWKVYEGNVFTKKFGHRPQVPPQGSKTNSSTYTKHYNKKEEESKKPKVVELPEIITVKSLIDLCKISIADMMKELIKNGLMLSINDQLDKETAIILLTDLGFEIKEQEQEKTITIADIIISGQKEERLKTRDPIVVVMGHVDHGKTTLLDMIRKTNVVASEAGGITQHIGAYQVKHNNRYVTFLDTPGHEAFTNIRAKGSSVTDIAILIVAANDGVMPITKEAINHAKVAKVPIIVAINKIDIEGVNIENVKGQLADNGLISEDWGGDTVMVSISAKNNINLDKLLDMVLLVADMKDLKADFEQDAIATVIESNMDNKLGPVASVIINAGTLKKNDNVVIGPAFGKIRIIMDEYGKQMSKAPASRAVKIAGFDKMPVVGDFLRVFPDIDTCKQMAMKEYLKRNARYLQAKKISLFDYSSRFAKSNISSLKVIVKADAEGSLSAIIDHISKIKTEKSYVHIIHSAMGSVSESDIMLAKTSDAIITCFNIKSNPIMNRMALKEGVLINYYNIIYELFNDIEKTLLGMIKEELVEVLEGIMTIKKVFATFKNELIVGGYINEGKIKKGATFKIIRNNEEVGNGDLISVHKGSDEVSEMLADNECGVKIKTKIIIQEKDVLEFYNKQIKEHKIIK